MSVPRTKHVRLGAHTLELYSIGYLSDISELAVVTLRLWERQGVLPKPILRIAGGIRFYTALEIAVYAALIRDHYMADRDKRKLRANFYAKATEIRQRLKQIESSPTCPTEFTRLLVKPKQKWTYEDAAKNSKS